MSSKEKKTYDPPAIERIPLSDDALDMVTGGTQPDGGTGDSDSPLDHDEGYSEDGGIGTTNTENTDVGRGNGRGGACRSPIKHRAPRSFSGGRNMGC